MQLIQSFLSRRIHPVSAPYPPCIRATPSCNPRDASILCAVVTVSAHLEFLAGARAQGAVTTEIQIEVGKKEIGKNKKWIGEVPGYANYGAQPFAAAILSQRPAPGYRPDTTADTAPIANFPPHFAHVASFGATAIVVPPRDSIAHVATGAEVPEWQATYPNLTPAIGTSRAKLESDGRGNE